MSMPILYRYTCNHIPQNSTIFQYITYTNFFYCFNWQIIKKDLTAYINTKKNSTSYFSHVYLDVPEQLRVTYGADHEATILEH